jgi:phage terminase large subunit-like protein
MSSQHSESARLQADLFAKFCRESLITENGGPLVLEDWQHGVMMDLFDGCQEAVILLPKGNGKTTLFGAMSLFHLLTTRDARCYIAAASRDQATLMYQHAAGFVQRSDALAELILVRAGYRELRSKADSGFCKVLASDSNTADGVAGTLCLVDELHRHKTPDLYAVFRDGLGKRDGQMVTISTAGADQRSPLGLLRDRAHLLEDRELDGFHFRARSPDGSFVAHEWAVPEGQGFDTDDIDVVKKANPSSFVTVEDLRRRRESPSMHEREWLRFACNQWKGSVDDAWIEPGKWGALADFNVAIADGADVWVGVDIGLRHDTSAVVVISHEPGDDENEPGRWIVECEVFEPPEGGELQLSLVENHIMGLFDRYLVKGVVYDRWAFSRSAQEIEARAGVGTTIEFPMTNERTVPACARLLEAVNRGEFVHNGDPVLESHIENGAVRMTERGWRISKGRTSQIGGGKIDALIALLLVFTIASQGTGAGSVYENQDLVVL